MMEFRRPDAPVDPRRIGAIVDAVRPLLGATKSAHVFVAGGHGMWGVVLGPLTGKLLARQMVSGIVPDELRPLDPLR